MSVKCQAIIDAMNQFAPASLAYKWDNVGLIVGHPQQEIHKVLISLDVTPQVVDEACALGADMIVAHHPLIFKEIKKIRFDSPLGSLLQKIIKNDIAIFAAHTNLDIVNQGVNDVLANQLCLDDIGPLEKIGSEELVKFVVFVPESHENIVRTAILEAGAGHIGKYSHCTFNTNGVGTFMPLAGTNPFIGQPEQLEQVNECRIETILPERIAPKVIEAMVAVHPYEEVAYDVYPLYNRGSEFGLGRIGNLAKEVMLGDFIQQVKQALSLQYVCAAGDLAKNIRRVAVCGGSGASLIEIAAQAGADVLITGDVKYHEAQQAVSLGIAVIDAGHFATEQPVIYAIEKYLNAQNMPIAIVGESVNKNIFAIC